jgi:Deacetylases, including yeast histone deacetylase and acetoin utilization protein
MPCTVVTGDVFSGHDDPGHPESQARLDAALTGVPAGTDCIAPVRAAPGDLALVHTERHIETLRQLCRALPPGRALYLDPDTYITAGSFDAALYAAGGGVAGGGTGARGWSTVLL